ncbi:MAG: hypothetical protein IJ774_08270 [Selenomonadaceae bacterium]|nr:hypothetical protein [Selenomonadaceae bacterium]
MDAISPYHCKAVDFVATLGIQTPIVYVNNPVCDRTNNLFAVFGEKISARRRHDFA